MSIQIPADTDEERRQAQRKQIRREATEVQENWELLQKLNARLLAGAESTERFGQELGQALGAVQVLKGKLGRAKHVAYFDTVRKVPVDTRPASERDAELSQMAVDFARAQDEAKTLKSKLGAVRQEMHFDRMRRKKLIREMRAVCDNWSRFARDGASTESEGYQLWQQLESDLSGEEMREP